MDGWIRSYRKMFENPIITKDAEYLAVWVYLLHYATHTGYDTLFGGKRITLKPGQLVISRKSISEKLKISESKVQRILKTFENEQQIEQQMTRQNRLVSLLNWDRYQNSEQQIEQQVNDNRTASEQQVNDNRTASEQQVNTNNNDNNEIIMSNNDNKEKDTTCYCPVVSDEPIQTEQQPETFITWKTNTNKDYVITVDYVEEMKELYPAVDVEQAFRNMKGWLMADPTRRKTEKGMKRFINHWLSEDQNKGGSRSYRSYKRQDENKGGWADV